MRARLVVTAASIALLATPLNCGRRGGDTSGAGASVASSASSVASIAAPSTASASPDDIELRSSGLELAGMRLLTDLTSGDDKGAREELTGNVAPETVTAWFGDTFGDSTGGALAQEWRSTVYDRLDDAVSALRAEVRSGKTEVSAKGSDRAGSADATGLQRAALGAMKKQEALYTLQLVRPGETTGFALWSFAYIDHHMVLVGKMSKVKG
jgi:hypothetical protein